MLRGAAAGLYDTEILTAGSVDYVLLTGTELRHDGGTLFCIHKDDLAVHPRELVAGEQGIVVAILAGDFCLFEGVFCHRFSLIVMREVGIRPKPRPTVSIRSHLDSLKAIIDQL